MDIKHIAKLARIQISEEEENKFQKDLGSILEFIEKLNQADTSSVEPMYHATGLVNMYRPDQHRKDFEMNENLNERLINQAPKTENRFIKVRSVLSKNGK